MSVDPTIDYHAHDPEDRDEPSEDPRIREAQKLEQRMREALATKENPLRDGESTSDRLKAGKNEEWEAGRAGLPDSVEQTPEEPSGE